MAAELKEFANIDATLVPGSGGIFEIRRDGAVIWKKERSGHFPEEGEATKLFQ